MAIQYIFVKVSSNSVSEAPRITDDTYITSEGVYRVIDAGSAAGEMLTRADMKEIFDEDKRVWGDEKSRNTLLFWNSVQKCLMINICGWASANIDEVKTSGTEHPDGLLLRECDIKPMSFTSTVFRTFGTLIDADGQTVKLVDKQQSNLSSQNGDAVNFSLARGLSISGSSVPDQNTTRTPSYFFNSTGTVAFNNIMFFKSDKSLYAYNTLNYFRTSASYVAIKINNNEIAIGIGFGRQFIAPTKTQFTPETLVSTIPAKEMVSAITSIGDNPRYGGAADSICIDSTNLSQMHTPTGGNSDTSITQISHVQNTGDDPFGLKAGGKSVNCTFWIPTLQGATATSKNDPSRVLRFSVCSNSYGGRIGIGSVHRNFAYTSANETNLEEFISDEKHRVCLFVKNSESPHSFKYSWAQPLTLKFKYRNIANQYFYTSTQTNMFTFVHNRVVGGFGSEFLLLDPANIAQEFKLDYSSAGVVDGSSTINPSRTKGLTYLRSSLVVQSYWFNSKLGALDNIDYVHGNSYPATTPASSDSFVIGSTDRKASVSAVYPTSG